MRARRVSRRLVRLAALLAAAAAPAACHSPRGNLEGVFQVSSDPGAIRVTGWAFDPDVSAPIVIVVLVGGRIVGYGPADRPRPDVPAVLPGAPPATGFDLSFPPPDGWHEVCVQGIDRSGNPPGGLGCRHVRVGEVVTPVDRRYRASVLTAGPGPLDTNSVTVSGGSTATCGSCSRRPTSRNRWTSRPAATWCGASDGVLQQRGATRTTV